MEETKKENVLEEQLIYPRITLKDVYKLTDERGYSRNGGLAAFNEGQFFHETLLRLKNLEKEVAELKK